MLSWDVIVLNGYLLLNVHICGYPALLPLPAEETREVVLHSVRLHRDRLGGFDSHGHGVSLRRPGRPAVLEFRDCRSALSRFGVHGRPGADHPGDAGGSPRPHTFSLWAAGRRRPKRSPPPPAPPPYIFFFWALPSPHLGAFSRPFPEEIFGGGGVFCGSGGGGSLVPRRETETPMPSFVLKGRVVVKREESGRFRITRSVGPGEQFGEISALAGTPRLATAIRRRTHPRPAFAGRVVAQADEEPRR